MVLHCFFPTWRGIKVFARLAKTRTAEHSHSPADDPLPYLLAAIGVPHDIKGEGIYAYITLMVGDNCDPETLEAELVDMVRKEIGPFAKPDAIQWAPGLPKTRSGKIMRRILRKIAADELDNLGDTTTLADPSVVDDLITNRRSTSG